MTFAAHPRISIDVASLLRELTLEEKASLCLGSDSWHTAPIERLGVPTVRLSDGPHGLRKESGQGVDRVGVGRSLPATCFPTAAALGSSWDTELLYRVGVALGEECRAQGVDVLLGPGINIKRSPLCGRNFEYFSEDPLLSGALGSAIARGIQSRSVGTAVKHFAANNQETDRLRVSVDVDERTLREIYLPAFEHVVKEARPWMVMCSYNQVNGVHASQNTWLLTDLLRHEWGFEGAVVSDWGAVHDRVAAVEAGLDLEMPPNLGRSDTQLVAAVRSGRLDEETLDAAAARVLTLVNQARAVEEGPGSFDEAAHHALARSAAASCGVLLKNVAEVLPLKPASGDTIAVIGEFARTPRFQGAGSSEVNCTRLDIPVEQLLAGVHHQVKVGFAAGFGIETTDHDAALADEAVELARTADVVVLFLGLPAADESEGYDRTHLDLPGNQIALLEQLAVLDLPIVVVLSNGSVVRLNGWEHHADAILECWLAGQAAGGAIADLLLGVANPSGRLAETIPVRIEDCPAYLNFPGELGRVRYGEGVFVGYRGYDRRVQEVSYPFGHGLSYTSFEYDCFDVTVTGSHASGDLAVDVTCRVTNTGRRAGSEVVQLYVADRESTVARPARELKGFTKLHLEPGQSGTARFTLVARDLSFWSAQRHGWVLEEGDFDIAVGASSRDLRFTRSIHISAPAPKPTFTRMSTLGEWLADPGGERALRAAFGTDASGRPNGILGDADQIRMMGNFPLSSLSAFPGIGLDHTTVDTLIAAMRGPEIDRPRVP